MSMRPASGILVSVSSATSGFQPSCAHFPCLARYAAAVAIPGAGFFNDASFHSQIDQFAGFGNTFAIENIKFVTRNGGATFLDHFHAGLIADHFIAVFNGPDAANV